MGRVPGMIKYDTRRAADCWCTTPALRTLLYVTLHLCVCLRCWGAGHRHDRAPSAAPGRVGRCHGRTHRAAAGDDQ